MIDLKTKIAKLIALEVEIGHFFFLLCHSNARSHCLCGPGRRAGAIKDTAATLQNHFREGSTLCAAPAAAACYTCIPGA